MTACFPDSYRAGRSAFLRAAADANLGTITRMHPQVSGRDGKPLFADTAAIGPRRAETALLAICGTHGVEGAFGSGILTAALRDPCIAGCAGRIVLLHALNPFGFSFDRRADENNVDVNRNFVDFAQVPDNPAYDRLADAVALPDLSAARIAAADRMLHAHAARHGEPAVLAALSAGQYRYPDGLCYGGAEPSWSRRVLDDVLREELKGVRRLIVLDLHTGIGGFGDDQIFCDDPEGSAAFARVCAIWPAAKASPSPATGLIGEGMQRRVDEVTFATLEIGTRPMHELLAALRRDLWLHCVAGGSAAQAEDIAAAMRDAFFPADAAWRASAMQAGCAALAAAATALE